MPEYKFKVKFVFNVGGEKEERWGTSSVMGGTLEEAIENVKYGFKVLGQKVLEIQQL